MQKYIYSESLFRSSQEGVLHCTKNEVFYYGFFQ